MADYDFSGGLPEAEARRISLATLTNMAGAVISLALVGGIGLWGYGMIMRDVSGVPVVRALEGPMRVAPEEPGGRPAAHQGLSVNRIAADEAAAPPPDQVIIAPQPLELASEDAMTTAPARPAPDARPQTADVHLAVLRAGRRVRRPSPRRCKSPRPRRARRSRAGWASRCGPDHVRQASIP